VNVDDILAKGNIDNIVAYSLGSGLESGYVPTMANDYSITLAGDVGAACPARQPTGRNLCLI